MNIVLSFVFRCLFLGAVIVFCGSGIQMWRDSELRSDVLTTECELNEFHVYYLNDDETPDKTEFIVKDNIPCYFSPRINSHFDSKWKAICFEKDIVGHCVAMQIYMAVSGFVLCCFLVYHLFGCLVQEWQGGYNYDDDDDDDDQ